MPSEPIEAFWREYQATLPLDSSAHGEAYEAAAFGDSPDLAEELGALVVSGTKTATCSALWEWEAESETLPEPGAKCVVLDGRDEPLCSIETVGVEVRPYNEVDARFAYYEGEGGSLATALEGDALALLHALAGGDRPESDARDASGVRAVPGSVFDRLDK